MTLEAALQGWTRWSQSAEGAQYYRTEDGWESYFPGWAELLDAAETVMLQDKHADREVDLLGRAMLLSEEDEDVAEMARRGLPATRELLLRLSRHESPIVRWQCYDVLGDLDEKDATYLAHGLCDLDAYARRRAFLAVFRKPERVTATLMEQVLSDPDAYNRGIAIRVGLGSGRADIVALARAALEKERDAFVRELALYAPKHPSD